MHIRSNSEELLTPIQITRISMKLKSFLSTISKKFSFPIYFPFFLTVTFLTMMFISLNKLTFEVLFGLFGTFVVTFLGVFMSFFLSRKLEYQKEQKESEKLYTSSLKLIFSELDINERVIRPLIDGLEEILKETGKFYDLYSFLEEIAKGVKTKAFYGSIYSNAIQEISSNDELFNSLQHAYYNTELAVNGLSLSKEAFKDYHGFKKNNIPELFIKKAEDIVRQETDKFRRALYLTTNAKKVIYNELKRRKVSFKNSSS